jgi:hypothetical protein
MSKSLGMVAIGLSAVGVVLGVVVGMLIAADDAQKEMNKTLVEGAGLADWSYKTAAHGVNEFSSSLREALNSAFALSSQFGGDDKDYTAIISQLQQGGFTYRELTQNGMELGANLEQLVIDSRAVGQSLAETAQQYAEFHETFGFGQKQIHESYMAIANAAQMSGMGTKRFFTAVSQATSGMALYNVRMEEAAGLLALTSKILGGADASEFIKSLTKGFSEESYQETTKRVLIAGAADTAKIFEGAVKRAVEAFSKDFAAQGPVLQAALEGAKIPLDAEVLNDPQKLMSAMLDLDDKDRRAVIAQLQANGGDAGRGLAEQLYQLDKLRDGMSKSLAAQVKGASAMDMQAKLAMSFQRLSELGEKRIADLSLQQLMALSETTGMSRDQIEKLGRIEDYIRAQFESDSQGFKTFEDFVAKGDLTNLHLEDQLATAKTAEDYASEIADKTITMSERLGMIYDLMRDTLMPMAEGMSSLVAYFTKGALGYLGPTILDEDSSRKALAQNRQEAGTTQKQLGDVTGMIAQLRGNGMSDSNQNMVWLLKEQERLQTLLSGLKKQEADLAKKVPEEVEKGTLEAMRRHAREELASGLAASTGQEFLKVLGDLESGRVGAYMVALKADAKLNAQARAMGIQDIPVPTSAPKAPSNFTPADTNLLFEDQKANDFVMRPGQKAQRFSSADTLVGLKDGGPLDKAMRGGGGGGNLTININGGDMSRVYQTVRTAIKVTKS